MSATVRPRRTPFTTRRLLLAVAVVAGLLGAYVMEQRHRRYREMADLCGALENHLREIVKGGPDAAREAWNCRGGPVVPRSVADYAMMVDDLARKRNRYERAAWTPWRFVDPDPAAE